MKLQHVHLTVNARISPEFRALSKEESDEFVKNLLSEIGMKALGAINWADAEDLEFPGQSFVQMITTSHCSLHFFDHRNGENEIYFDLYSCKEFDHEKVISMLDSKFGLLEYHGILYSRATESEPDVKKLNWKKD